MIDWPTLVAFSWWPFPWPPFNTRVVVLATTVLGLATGAIGSYTLLRRRALMGDALSHAMLPGIAIAFLLAPGLGLPEKSLPVLLGGAVVSGLLGTAAILLIRHWTRLQEDAALAIVLSVFFGGGLALLGIVQQSSGGAAAGLESFIYGKAASITLGDARAIVIVSVAALLGLALLRKELTLLCFDEGYARASGYPTLLLDAVLMLLVVLITVVGLQAVGLILMVALLVTPAAAARFWTTSLSRMTWLAAGLGAISCLGGSLASARLPDLPSGATIVLTASLVFGLSLLLGPHQGLVRRWVRARQWRRKMDREHVLRTAYELLEQQPAAADRSLSIERLQHARSWSPAQLRAALQLCLAAGLLQRRGDQVRLTAAGEQQAASVTRQHRMWELYLILHAEIAPSRVDQEAESIEHVLEPAMIAELEKWLPAYVSAGSVPACPHSPLTPPDPPPAGQPAAALRRRDEPEAAS